VSLPSTPQSADERERPVARLGHGSPSQGPCPRAPIPTRRGCWLARRRELNPKRGSPLRVRELDRRTAVDIGPHIVSHAVHHQSHQVDRSESAGYLHAKGGWAPRAEVSVDRASGAPRWRRRPARGTARSPRQWTRATSTSRRRPRPRVPPRPEVARGRRTNPRDGSRPSAAAPRRPGTRGRPDAGSGGSAASLAIRRPRAGPATSRRDATGVGRRTRPTETAERPRARGTRSGRGLPTSRGRTLRAAGT